MNSGLKIGILIGVATTVVLAILFAVYFENAKALSTAREVEVLQSVLESELQDESLCESASRVELGCFIVHPGQPHAISLSDPDSEAAAQLIAEIVRRGGAGAVFDQVLELDGYRYVWASMPRPQAHGTAVLFHRESRIRARQIVKLYTTPIVIGVLLIIWMGFWGVLITSRVLRERHLRLHSEAEARHHEEVSQIKSAFLRNMSHEVRTPLDAILGFSEAMRLGQVCQDKTPEYSALIHESGKHMLRLVENILDISRIEAGDHELHEETFKVDEAIQASIAIISPVITKRGHAVEVEVDLAVTSIHADRLKISQVIINLVTNAAKFSKDAGTIRVLCERLTDGGIQFSITDNGRGIAQKDIEIVMRPFGRLIDNADLTADGTGLGLPLSRMLVELHGGELEIDSEPGVGTTVSFTLPADRVVAT